MVFKGARKAAEEHIKNGTIGGHGNPFAGSYRDGPRDANKRLEKVKPFTRAYEDR